MADNDRFEGQAEDSQHLRDSLESAWDEGQAVADEKQVSADVVALEIDRRDPSDREIAEAAYDASVMRREARERRIEAVNGYRDESRPVALDEKAQSRNKVLADLRAEWDRLSGETADKPTKSTDKTLPTPGKSSEPAAETKPAQTEQPQPQPQPEPEPRAEWSAEDRAFLDRQSPEARQYIEGKAAAMRETYAPADALAGKWSGYLSEQLGADTPAKQAGMVDRLLSTERALRTGTPEQRQAILTDLARQYLGAPAQAPAPQPAAPALNPLQRAAQNSPSPNPEAQAAAYRERAREVVGEIQKFAAEKDASGHPKHALIRAVEPEMAQAVQMLQQAGRPVDLPTVYKAAVAAAAQTRPEVAQAAMADNRARVQAFTWANPVASNAQLQRRMVSVAKPDMRINGTVDLKSVLDRALQREPEIAARQEAHAAAEKKLGFDKPRPSLRQLLEAGYDAQTA